MPGYNFGGAKAEELLARLKALKKLNVEKAKKGKNKCD